ncbi:MAG: DUF1700 domain-containing protein [Clostridiales bacterium]|nr:DUF1700 domain-containing protein [Clostridiales bacterium]
MTKHDFLDSLGRRLSQTLPQEKVTEHIRYYDSYLTEKIENGLLEEEAVEELGDPLLIARTIMDAGENAGSRRVIYEENPERENDWSVEREKNPGENRGRQVSIHTRGGCLLAAVIVLLVLGVIFWLVGSVVSFLLPIMIPVLVIGLIISFFKQK